MAAVINRDDILRLHMNGKTVKEIALTLWISEAAVEAVITKKDIAKMEAAGMAEGKMINDGFSYAAQIAAGTPVGSFQNQDYLRKSMQKANAVTMEYKNSPVMYPNVFALMRKKGISLSAIAATAGVGESVVVNLLNGRPRVTYDYKYELSPKYVAVVDAILSLSGQEFNKLFLCDRNKYLAKSVDTFTHASCVYPKIADWMDREKISFRGLAAYAGVGTTSVCHLLSGEVAIMDDILQLRAKKPVSATIVRTILGLSGMTYQEAFLDAWSSIADVNAKYLAARRAKNKVSQLVATAASRVVPLKDSRDDFEDYATKRFSFDHYAVVTMRPEDIFVGTRHVEKGVWADMSALFEKNAADASQNTQLLGICSNGDEMILAFNGCDGTDEPKWVCR